MDEAPDTFIADSDQAEVASACVCCGENGITRMLLTKIPHFNDIVVISFECNSCGYSNNEIQGVSSIKDRGVKIKVEVNTSKGLNNQVVISNHSSIKIVEIDFEVPPIPQKGVVTTIEGLVSGISSNLDEHIKSIAEALVTNVDLNIQLTTGEVKSATEYIHILSEIKDKLVSYSSGTEPFTILIDDPSGNSYVENTESIVLSEETYQRSEEQLKAMGYATKEETSQELDLTKPLEDEDVGKEGLSLIVDCPNCGLQGHNKICEVLVPGFGSCVIMAFTCENCGSKTNEMKPGGGYKDFGKKWKLVVESPQDLNRDVIISETATIFIAHLDFEMTPGTIGSAFTSLEGLIIKMVEGLESSHPFLIGDSAPESQSDLKEKIKQLSQLSKLEGIKSFTLVIDDPADHSFIGPRPNQSGEDPNLVFETYTRTYEQDEELGLIGMNTEDY
ncbi:zinc finger protein zpr1 domain containing protein [Theileria equi strain WA]|uniref:Zinc finger protein zpr1 domain containing protein n=1 Tax=Theileria equi strain WA TaxID=1537102 RepID=L0AYB2_THEEQ|nr:zinc finger protein zpr1 domain containing protein [Theileria equi strain WA]AFZ80248.1 zinc finger protein zpr1 domain containing protein [Theileria equi strain WA]|eukprot:XP_004829914.1 zinc finger protein zpr1 domain containing protein [Theileria equi strain WA]